MRSRRACTVATAPIGYLHFDRMGLFASVPANLAAARQTGIPVPAPHSPEWAPDREPTIKAAIRAEVTALLELLRGN